MDFGSVDGGDVEVVVTGAGPTGLTLACDLARRGVRALLVERGSRLAPGSREQELRPRAQEVLDDLGVLGTVRAVGAPHPALRYWEDGEPRADRDLFERGGSVPYPEVWAVPQWRTREILHARLRELGGDVVFGAALTGPTPAADGVEVRLVCQGRARTVRAAYVVDTDGGTDGGTGGGAGTVRSALGIAGSAEAFDGRPVLVADILADGLDRNHRHIWPGAKGGALALSPLACADTFHLLARYEDEDARPDLSEEGIRHLIAERTHLSVVDVRGVRWATAFREAAALADSYRSGRVLLAGDAAHVHPPFGGLGLDTGVQDAHNLGWKLGMVLRHGADPALLDSYEEERRPAAAAAIAEGARLHRDFLLTADEPARRPLPPDTGHRGTSLAVDTRRRLPPGALRAGDRAPDAPCGHARILDLFRGPHFTLLAFGAVEPPPLDGFPVVTYRVHPEDRPAHEAYASRGLFLVRPDGYVGWAGSGGAGLRAYVARLGKAQASRMIRTEGPLQEVGVH
ncbi:FAD-dependent monooxygenase [Streptomyces sp. NPDC002537]